MQKRRKKNRLFNWWRALHLVDRLLLVFMVILLIQSAHNLFFHELSHQNTEALDVVIRTTAAAIFGYFISAGFRGTSGQEAAPGQDTIGFTAPSKSNNAPVAHIGFATETAAEENTLPLGKPHINSERAINRRIRQQLIIVAIIGILSLVLLVLARNYTQPSAEAIATLSQLRDFVSGSVGFLIGHSGSLQN